MAARLVALDEGPDIPLDRTMVVVGRHPQCDARLDSLRVSRHHCCMTLDDGDVVVRDLGSTNGVRINGQRVEVGRLRPGDELSIAHIRYRLDNGSNQEMTLADSVASPESSGLGSGSSDGPVRVNLGPANSPIARGVDFEEPLAAAVREILPAGLAHNCRIQVIVKMGKDFSDGEVPAACQPD
jgi:pSer/pThr/pTyr-binding forkhead associated (FHA) protein